VERFGDGSAWPGNYRELDVDLAWCAWSAAMATTRERCAQILEHIASEPPVNGNELAQARVLMAAAAVRGA
jgi:transcriptional regulator of acetoin/glycerol metabolism